MSMIPLTNININSGSETKPKQSYKTKDIHGTENFNFNTKPKNYLAYAECIQSQDMETSIVEKSKDTHEDQGKFLANKDNPIPKGNSAYSKAKRHEINRNLPMAEKYYRLAIKNGERLESAIKDLATIMHQQGKTHEACEFLEYNKASYKGDMLKYENLLNNLKKQLIPSGNCLNKTLLLFDVEEDFTEEKLKKIFKNSSSNKKSNYHYKLVLILGILGVEFSYSISIEDISHFSLTQFEQSNNQNPHRKYRSCLMGFASYSAAKKTMETIIEPGKYQFYWMNVYGHVVGPYNSDYKSAISIITHDKDTTDSAESTEIYDMPILNNENIILANDNRVEYNIIMSGEAYPEQQRPIERKINFDFEEISSQKKYKNPIQMEALNEHSNYQNMEYEDFGNSYGVMEYQQGAYENISSAKTNRINLNLEHLKSINKNNEGLIKMNSEAHLNPIYQNERINNQNIKDQGTPGKKLHQSQHQTSPTTQEKSIHPYIKSPMTENQRIIENIPEPQVRYQNLINSTSPAISSSPQKASPTKNSTKSNFNDQIFTKFFPRVDEAFPKSFAQNKNTPVFKQTDLSEKFKRNFNNKPSLISALQQANHINVSFISLTMNSIPNTKANSQFFTSNNEFNHSNQSSRNPTIQYTHSSISSITPNMHFIQYDKNSRRLAQISSENTEFMNITQQNYNDSISFEKSNHIYKTFYNEQAWHNRISYYC